jgi:hypothetical protein
MMHLPLMGIISNAVGGANSMIVSIETTTMILPYGAVKTVDVPLTMGQDASQCVPFFSMHYPDSVTGNQTAYSDTGCVSVDLWDDAGTATLTASTYSANAGTAKIEIKVTVIEWAADIRVQKIPFEAPASGTATWTEAITAIDQGKAFVVITQRDREIGGLDAREGQVQTTWDSDTVLRFTRGVSGSAIDKVGGWAWVVEDISEDNDFFKVTEYTHYSNLTTSTKTITAVADVDKTWIITNKYYHGTIGGHRASADGDIQDATTLRMRRSETGNYTTMTFYVIEFQDGTTVQRGYKSYAQIAAVGTLQTWTQAITPVADESLSLAMLNDAHSWRSQVRHAASSTWGQIPSMPSMVLDSGGEGLTGTFRGSTWNAAHTFYANWQVVEFDAGSV